MSEGLPLFRTLVRSSRPPFLVLMAVCVLLGIAAAVYTHGSVDGLRAGLVMLGGLLAHVAVNALNEYQDFTSGLDLRTERTPFSGGSGALVDNPAAAPAVLGLSLLSLGAAILTGLYLVGQAGAGLLPLGCAGVVLILAYTRWLNRNPWACLLAPGLGFGPLVVLGSGYALTGAYLPVAAWASLLPMCLASGLLLVNQIPDIEPDRQAGRRHLMIVHGQAAGTRAYAVLMLAAATSVIAGIAFGPLPDLAWVSLLPLLVAPRVLFAIRCHQAGIVHLLPFMGLNVALTILAPLVLAMVLFSSTDPLTP